MPAEFIASYDLQEGNPSPHLAVLGLASSFSWYSWLEMESGATFKLPNTTLHGVHENIDAALVSFDRLLAEASQRVGYRIVLEKRAIIPLGKGYFTSDEQRAAQRPKARIDHGLGIRY